MRNPTPNIETFIGCDADYAEAKIVLYGAPFDSTTLGDRPSARGYASSGWVGRNASGAYTC